jgi:hypothetical protein
MKKLTYLVVFVILGVGIVVAQDLVSFLHGTIKKVDSATKTIVVKSADGTEHTIKITDASVVKGSKDGFNGLKEGTEVVARTTGKGADETATEIGKVGKDGFMATKGTVEKFDKDAKTLVIKGADGTEKTFEVSDKAVEDAGKATGAGIAKGSKITVYYTEDAGKKVAHYLSQ